MDQTSIEYIVKSLDRRIKDLTKFINTHKRIAREMEWEIKKKKTKSNGVIQMEYYEDTSTKILNESNEKIASQQPHLDNFIKAREDFKKEFGI